MLVDAPTSESTFVPESNDAVRVVIENFLWVDHTGLASLAYSEGDVKAKREDVFRHVCRVYPTVPSPYYIVR